MKMSQAQHKEQSRDTVPTRSVFPPIEDYGLIGDCHTAALVSSHGSIDWLCLPRFDSPSLFARILDLERGGFWHIQPATAFRSTHRYLPNTNILETIFTCAHGRVRLLDCMEVEPPAPGTNRGNTIPGRIIRVLEGIDGTVDMVSVCMPRPDYARSIPQFTRQEQGIAFDTYLVTAPADWEIDTRMHLLTSRVTISAGERAAFTLALQGAPIVYASPFEALDATRDFWEQWAARCTYYGPYRDTVVRSALVLKLLIYDPTGAIVAAPTTSLPEEIGGERNWDYRFTWIRDASFTLYALLLAGYHEEDDAFFAWVARTVHLEGTGIHVLYPITAEGQTEEQTLEHLQGYRDSRPVRIGNAAAPQVQLDTYGEVLDALHFAWQVGRYDPAPVWQAFRPLIDWVADHWREPGNGIWEVRGGMRNFVYSKAMTWVALERGIELAEANGLDGDIARWRQERDQIRAEVMQKGWSERLGAFKQSYEDEHLDAANLLLPIVGFIDGTDPRMLSTIDATIEHLVVDGLCYRYLDAPEGIEGGEASFVLCTFWLIDALILAGRVQEAQERFERMLDRASSLGLFAEEIDPTTNAHLGNFPQAFSHLGIINVAVSLAHVGQIGTVHPQHAATARTAHSGGGGKGKSPATD